jgi:hypothetical protein
MNWLWTIIAIVSLGALGFGVYRAVGNPAFWTKLASMAVSAALPKLASVLKPRDMTEQELSDYRANISEKERREFPNGGTKTVKQNRPFKSWRDRQRDGR